MAQTAAWPLSVSPEGRSDFGMNGDANVQQTNASRSNPDIARWELAEILKTSSGMSRVAVDASSAPGHSAYPQSHLRPGPPRPRRPGAPDRQPHAFVRWRQDGCFRPISV
ncbi:hypothetical protein EVG20_g2697, partial [Dentipellis fragilis]